jgi:hypothetical protein
MFFRVMCALDELANKMCDEPIAYDLAQPFVTRVCIYKQRPTSEVPNGGPLPGAPYLASEMWAFVHARNGVYLPSLTGSRLLGTNLGLDE